MNSPNDFIDTAHAYVWAHPWAMFATCAAFCLTVWILGYWVGCARGRYLERQIKTMDVSFQGESIHISTTGERPVITPMRTVRTENADPGAYAHFGSN